MQVEKFDELLEGWSDGKYTPQELITHLMKHAKEMAATVNHHVRLMAVMENRLAEAEEKLKAMKERSGEQ